METFVFLLEWRGGKGVGKAQGPLPLCVVRCPIATSGHYKSYIVGSQHFLILATAQSMQKGTSMFCLA